jgi:hypothetical protein
MVSAGGEVLMTKIYSPMNLSTFRTWITGLGCAFALALVSLNLALVAAPIGTAFSYQGRLGDGVSAATGQYDFTFKLFDALAGPNQRGSTVSLPAVGVTNGLFNVSIDFGAGVFDGTAGWIEIEVKSNGVAGYTMLSPRQPVLPAPYAFFATTASNAASASAVGTGAVDSAGVTDYSLFESDIAAGQVVKSLNGLHDAISLLVGPNLSLTPGASSLTLDATSDWKRSGNLGTVPGIDFIGTTDRQDLVFKVNNAETLRLSTSQDLILPDVPSFILGFGGINGLGTYGQAFDPFQGTPVGRTFGGVDVGGIVLYGENGGGLGLKYQAGIFNPIQEKLVMRWSLEEVAVAAQRGLSLQAFDGPIITRGWDTFNSSAGPTKSGLGRWGLFMEPGQLVCGIPDLDVPGGDRSFSVQKYTAGGARTELMRVDNRLGYLAVNGAGGEQAYIGGDGFGNDVQIGSLNSGVQNVAFYNGTSGSYMHVYVKALTIVGGSDLAEPFAMSHPDVAAGSVVVIDPAHPGRLTLSTQAYDRKVAGVVSGAGGINPGLSMIQADKLEAGTNVALSGRVYVRSDASKDPIEPGDLLTTSDRPGYAMKARDHHLAQGAILGKAMTGLTNDTGLVLVLVTLQ